MIIIRNKLYQPIGVFVNPIEEKTIKAKGTIKVPGDEVTNHMIQLKEAGWITFEVRKELKHLRKPKVAKVEVAKVEAEAEAEAEIAEAEVEPAIEDNEE